MKKIGAKKIIDIHSAEVDKDINTLTTAFNKFSWKYGTAIAGFTLRRLKKSCWNLTVSMAGESLQ